MIASGGAVYETAVARVQILRSGYGIMHPVVGFSARDDARDVESRSILPRDESRGLFAATGGSRRSREIRDVFHRQFPERHRLASDSRVDRRRKIANRCLALARSLRVSCSRS